MNDTEIIFSLLSKPKVRKIMKYVNKTPRTIPEIAFATSIPSSIVYRFVAQLAKNKYIIAIPANTQKMGRTDYKYCRGKKYKIIITPDGAKII